MCGIAGILNLHSSEPIPRGLLYRMIDILKHRGPDGSGAYLGEGVALGHSRLSIIDLSGGAQPIHNEDQSLWIVYNGEVFNYPELREGLLARGHRFYTETDTEVILHLYEEKGAACLEELNGQFAFVIWDAARKVLFMARDRTGIVPLHYARHGGRLYFASEVKAILLAPGFPRRLDLEGLDQVFTFWTTLPGRTVFEGVAELPAGTCLTVTDGRLTERRYWDFPFQENGSHRGFDQVEAVREEATALLRDAIRIRLRADVPVGSYLSGGIDSSGLTAMIRSHFDNRLRTFGITFEEKAFDERQYQETLVRHLDTDHSSIEARNEDIRENFARTLWHCERPILRTAPVPLYLLSGLVRRQSYKVVVTGEGADEVFGGYNIFRETKARLFWARDPASRMRPLLIGKLYPYIFKDGRLKESVKSFFGTGIQDVGNPFYSHLIRWGNTQKTKTFFSDQTRGAVDGYNGIEDLSGLLPANFSSWDPVSRAQYLEMKIFLSDYLLSSQGDRVSMGHSVESRPPFLDHRLLEMMAGVSPHLKIRAMCEKYLLKKVFEGYLPHEILHRAKHPYRAPIRNTFVAGDCSLLRRHLAKESILEAGVFDVSRVSMLVKKAERFNHLGEMNEMALAGVLSTQILHSQFIRRSPAADSDPIVPAVVFGG